MNSCCPGFVITDMTADLSALQDSVTKSDDGDHDFLASPGKSPADGAKTPIYLSLIPAGMTEPQGRLMLDA